VPVRDRVVEDVEYRDGVLCDLIGCAIGIFLPKLIKSSVAKNTCRFRIEGSVTDMLRDPLKVNKGCGHNNADVLSLHSHVGGILSVEIRHVSNVIGGVTRGLVPRLEMSASLVVTMLFVRPYLGGVTIEARVSATQGSEMAGFLRTIVLSIIWKNWW
jgi:hypothetical protein